MDSIEMSPGVLAGVQLRELATKEAILSLSDGDGTRSFDASAFDLRLSDDVWRLSDGQRPTTKDLSQIRARAKSLKLSEDECGPYFEFERGQIYLVRLDDYLNLPENVSGRATGKSSVGRLDVITRLITANSQEYDLVRPGYQGELHLLIVPQTFSIRVAPGGSLNQLRLFCGPQHACVIRRDVAAHYGSPFWFTERKKGHPTAWDLTAGDPMIDDPTLFDLTVELSDPDEAFVYKAKTEEVPILDLRDRRKGIFDPCEYFERIEVNENAGDRYVVLDKQGFYIMKSRERLHIPKSVAVEVVAISERIGDIRIHYAGFAHPGFGRTRGDSRSGTPLIFEVRATDMQTRLSSASILARIQLFQMSSPVPLDEESPSDYEQQELKLSSVFKDWPDATD